MRMWEIHETIINDCWAESQTNHNLQNTGTKDGRFNDCWAESQTNHNLQYTGTKDVYLKGLLCFQIWMT